VWLLFFLKDPAKQEALSPKVKKSGRYLHWGEGREKFF
jgi:hypothetical protein